MPPDYHLHTPLCKHAEGHPREYAAAAVALGLPEIGMSDHSPMKSHFDDWRMEWEEFPRYLEMVDEARAQYPSLPIRLGLEVDYLEGGEAWVEELATKAPFDYLIGSVHYIAPGWDVDNPKHLSRFAEHGVGEIWATYWKLFEKAIRSRLFDFMGHPDLPKKFGHRPSGDLRPYYAPTIQALADTGTAIEINTAGLRKDVREMYPSREFLEMAFSAGVPLLINSDAHAPGEVGADFDKAVALAREVGYTHTLKFVGRTATPIPL
ncbi:histidinol-phosphatase HisJ family protein [Verrucomicrobium sp. BvORR034]|uniref:histidinol-phosphatase HisJ family protein n=1 Tax=Verrucomicrobium sp. BvORR034 TaxID=1396418 RepID=UPI0006788409|nr:histidinol-phosphatase HisJ family protein [Verrucomicrobium sp. BvORR034]